MNGLLFILMAAGALQLIAFVICAVFGTLRHVTVDRAIDFLYSIMLAIYALVLWVSQ